MRVVTNSRVTVDECNVTAGSLLTTDAGGPYNLTLLPVQSNEIKSGWQACASTAELMVLSDVVLRSWSHLVQARWHSV